EAEDDDDDKKLEQRESFRVRSARRSLIVRAPIREAPTANHQAPEKLQVPSSRSREAALEVGAWCFSGAWWLVVRMVTASLECCLCSHRRWLWRSYCRRTCRRDRGTRS